MFKLLLILHPIFNNLHWKQSKFLLVLQHVQQFWEKAPGQIWGKMIDFNNVKIRKNYLQKHNNGSKIDSQNQVILD